jgi:hypothetical protein
MIRSIELGSGIALEGVVCDGARVTGCIRREPMTRADWTTHDYNVHFVVGLENTGTDERSVELSVNGGTWDSLPNFQPALYVADAEGGPYTLSDLPGRTDRGKRYSARVALRAGQRLFISNTMVRTQAELASEFDAIGREGGAERRVIGRSLQGRDIVAYVYGDPTWQGTLLVSSGFHPPEPDTLATRAIMEHLARPEGKALIEILAVAVVPVTNPDGYALETQGSNAAGINFYWHFARELPDRCPEAAVLWAFATKLAPRGYIDFHCYTFQLGKNPGPYQRPLRFYRAVAVKRACGALYASLSRYQDTAPVKGFSAYAPHTLGAMLTARFDTISLAKYHLHLVEGVPGCTARGLRVFLHMADALETAGLTMPATPRPKSWWWDALLRVDILWAGLLRPLIGNIRRGNLSRVCLNRTSLVRADDNA